MKEQQSLFDLQHLPFQLDNAHALQILRFSRRNQYKSTHRHNAGTRQQASKFPAMRTIPGNRTCPSAFRSGLKLTPTSLCHKIGWKTSRATYRWEKPLFLPGNRSHSDTRSCESVAARRLLRNGTTSIQSGTECEIQTKPRAFQTLEDPHSYPDIDPELPKCAWTQHKTE